ncbi:hypothetical protein QBC35DRAFT_477596 [Podospora australis]|uniref:DNA2/NAM7 helicase helicase domain-containing protein n=1 Tax=Podospora australis TaxID=1536484 RepID=A0AAN6WPM0_9PEZI|nr:hypothetical protein QBC35DRAFT_477596 [Podospora australis]
MSASSTAMDGSQFIKVVPAMKGRKTIRQTALICETGFAGTFVGNLDGVDLGTLGSDVAVKFETSCMHDRSPYHGFNLDLPWQSPTKKRTSAFVFQVKLPHQAEQFTVAVQNVTGKEELPEQLRNLPKLSSVRIDLADGAEFTVEGFGAPFANPGYASDDWLNRHRPIVGSLDLVSLLRRRSLLFLIPSVEARNVPVAASSRAPLKPFRYPFNNALSRVMDIFYTHSAAKQIEEVVHGMYFVEGATSNKLGNRYFGIMRVGKVFLTQYQSQWGRLTSDGRVDLIMRSPDVIEHVLLRCKIMDRPDLIAVLKGKHSFRSAPESNKNPKTDELSEDLVVMTHIPDDYIPAEDVRAVESFVKDAEPRPPSEKSKSLPSKMALHRAIMRGTGFWSTLTEHEGTRSNSPGDITLAGPRLRPLPRVDYLGISDSVLRNAIIQEALPDDRARAEKYASNCVLGVNLITAPSAQGGTGKTTAAVMMVIGALHCADAGKVFGSGPTNTAVTNFSLRTYARESVTVDRCGSSSVGSSQFRRYNRPFVLRGFSLNHEVAVFVQILQDRIADDSSAAKAVRGSVTLTWTLALSPSNWLLAIFKSKGLRASTVTPVTELDPADSPHLFSIQKELEDLARSPGPVKSLFQLAAGEITWEEYVKGATVDELFIKKQMGRLITAADVVMTTPALAQREPYIDAWSSAKVIAVDEAGCMHKADLCSIWGNTLQPIILAGDINQLPPTIMELSTTDADGNMLNRFALSSLGGLGARLATRPRSTPRHISCCNNCACPQRACSVWPRSCSTKIISCAMVRV